MKWLPDPVRDTILGHYDEGTNEEFEPEGPWDWPDDADEVEYDPEYSSDIPVEHLNDMVGIDDANWDKSVDARVRSVPYTYRERIIEDFETNQVSVTLMEFWEDDEKIGEVRKIYTFEYTDNGMTDDVTASIKVWAPEGSHVNIHDVQLMESSLSHVAVRKFGQRLSDRLDDGGGD